MTDKRIFSASDREKLNDAQLREMLIVLAEELRAHSSASCVTKPPVGVHPANALVYFSPAMQELFADMNKDNIEKLKAVFALKIETIQWLETKNEKDHAKFDKAVDFFATSSTAIKFLVLIIGTCATTLAAVYAAAKQGMDLFSMFRGGK